MILNQDDTKILKFPSNPSPNSFECAKHFFRMKNNFFRMKRFALPNEMASPFYVFNMSRPIKLGLDCRICC